MSAGITPLPRSFRLRLEMLTDWHVGTGAGRRGDVDRAVALDADGLPHVPGRTVTGIWRDACEHVASALDGADAGPWTALLAMVFGSRPALEGGPRHLPPTSAALSVREARLGGWLRHHLSGTGVAALRDALTFIKPAVRIDPRSGRAQDQHLRFDEMGRAGAVLWADCTLEVDADVERYAAALLCAGAVLVERIGGGRRRGNGRCVLRIEGADHAAAIDWLAAEAFPPRLPSAPPRVPIGEPPDMTVSVGGPDSGGGWREVHLLVRLLSPATFPSEVLGNLTRTHDHIPGRYLLPLVTRLGHDCGMDLGPAIRRGDVRTLAALPRLDGQRGIPIPLCLHRSKDPARRRHLWNELAGHSAEHTKQARAGYVAEVDGRVLLDEPEVMARAHSTIDDEEQRAGGDAGVYTIEALPAGTELEGILRMRVEVFAALAAAARASGRGEEWWSALAGQHALGRSRKDDYGLVDVQVIGVFTELEPAVASPRESRLHVWCRSDVVLRDDLLAAAPTAVALGGELARLLGLTQLRPAAGRTHTRVTRIDSWHTRWVLPRPSLIALAAGSVVEFEVTGNIDPVRLREVELVGVGERRAEGLGDVTFNDVLLDRERVECSAVGERTPPQAKAVAPDPDEAELAYACLIEECAWRSMLQAEAAANAALLLEKLHWAESPPTSQLGALRTALRGPQLPGSGAALEWLGRLRQVKNRRDLWPPAALDELERLLSERDRVWDLLGVDRWPVVGEDDATADRLRGTLWHEALVTMFDACARRRTRAA
jgi:CRISPR-associated protein Csx10